MSTPPWIRSTGESDPVVARLKARAGDPRPDSVHHGSTDPDPGLETGTGEASESPPQVPIEEPSASPTSLSDVPRELEVHPRPGADIAATLRGRVRGEKRDEGEEELPPPAHFPQSTLAILKTGSAIFGLVACIVGGFALGGGFDEPADVEAAAHSRAAEPTQNTSREEPDDPCRASQDAHHLRGNGPGDRLSSLGVVAAFEYAYYVKKDPEAAARLTTPEAGVAPERLHAEGIGVLPEGTEHCIDASTDGDNVVALRLTEFRPESAPLVIHQRIHTRLDEDGLYAITKIEHTGTPAG